MTGAGLALQTGLGKMGEGRGGRRGGGGAFAAVSCWAEECFGKNEKKEEEARLPYIREPGSVSTLGPHPGENA